MIETSRRIEAMEQERALVDERERIARELHDGTIQKVYTAGLLVRSAEKLTAKGHTACQPPGDCRRCVGRCYWRFASELKQAAFPG